MSGYIRRNCGYMCGYQPHFGGLSSTKYPQSTRMALTDTRIRALKPQQKSYKVADGGGLYIFVTTTGSKLWRMRYRYEGREKLLSFGHYPSVSLAKAREKRLEIKALLADGTDPRAHEEALKHSRLAQTEHTFENIAGELLEKLTKEGLSEATLKKKRWLLDFAIADFGGKPISEITPALILKTLKKIEAKGNYETAKRLRSTVGQVCRFAVATARLEADPTYSLRGALIAPKVSHMAAATSREDFARLVEAVWTYEGGAPATRAALKLMVLLYPRPGELRLALWEEFDLEVATWTIPAARTKMRREHIKPLPPMAVAILRDLRTETGSNYRVFPSAIARDKPISENTMNQALRRMGFEKDEHTSHGFRASASSLLNESGRWNEDAIEAELAHIGADQVRRAYHRARYWDERLRMADWWASEVGRMLVGST